MTPAESRRAKAKLKKELAAMLRRKDREAMAKIREDIIAARRARQDAVRGVVHQCRAARVNLKVRAIEVRRKAREEAAAQIARERAEARGRCELAKYEAREKGGHEVQQTRAALRAERQLQREVRAALQRQKQTTRLRRTSAEARAESDDAVRANLPSDLVPVFNAVRRQIPQRGNKSRTEAFLQWAEENPGEVVSIQQRAADVELEKLLRTEREHQTRMRKSGRYRQDPAALAAELEAVPF